MVRILLYGLQRSGTNFVESLLDWNFQIAWRNVSAPRNHPAHKHYRPYGGRAFPTQEYRTEDPPTTLKAMEAKLEPPLPTYYLIVSKSPYSWLLSYRKWARRCQWPEPNHHYIQEWNLFHRTWLEWQKSTERIIFTRYVDVLEMSQKELQQIRKKMGLQKGFKTCLQKLTPNKVDQSPNFDEERRRYYLERKFLDRFDSDELGLLNSQIEINTAQALGYEVVNI